MPNIYQFWVYFMTNSDNTVLYIGMTNDLYRRVLEHKTKVTRGSFAYKYNCNKLVYYEEYQQVEDAIAREKQLKKWNREWKNNLIVAENPEWRDLANDWVKEG